MFKIDYRNFSFIDFLFLFFIIFFIIGPILVLLLNYNIYEACKISFVVLIFMLCWIDMQILKQQIAQQKEKLEYDLENSQI